MTDQSLFQTDFDVRTSFVSLVDHLPAEIIRKLWLIQTLDIQSNSLKNELNTNLIRLQESQLTKSQSRSLVSEIMSISAKLTKTRQESLAEAKSIASSIKLARLRLDNQHQQLKHDHKIYLNEIEMQNNLVNHAQRSNKRTSTMKPSLKLKLNLKSTSSSSASADNSKPSTPSRSKVNKSATTTPKKNIIRLNTSATKSSPLPKSRTPKKPLIIIPKSKQKPQVQVQIEVEVQENIQEDNEDHTLYCICNRESFGEMVACDNSKCRKEWFHYACVGLVRAPRGRWLCPLCEKKKK